ncbi:MAG TPA: YhjD/YihY/BrkB family envelope integrity protein [Rectinemataceae bacterium]|nr:YhjD/YihY/BrkB family envelope integrity protein [Rectinemataceae bacterium]
MTASRERFKETIRVLTFVFERFGEHELANHAAAGAYAFLLAATPALLIVAGLAKPLLALFHGAGPAWTGLIARVFGSFATPERLARIYSPQIGSLAAIVATFSLIWAARLFILTVQRGLRVVWGVSPLEKPLRDNLLTFALEFAALLFVILVLGAAEAFRFFLDYLAPSAGSPVTFLSRLVTRAVPGVILFSYAYFTYRYIPPKGPRSRVAAAAALVALLVYGLFASFLSWAIDRTHYDLIYGVLGGLVVVLIKVWLFFMVYFHAAELAFILERYDSLLFARFLRSSRKPGGRGRRGPGLFGRPERLLARYGRRFEEGEIIFSEGDEGDEAFFLLEGEVGVWLDEGRGLSKVSAIGVGELFGEIAPLIGEARTATLVASRPCEVVILPPEIFDRLLSTDALVSRRVIDLLSRRLKAANLRRESLGGDVD